MFLLLYKIKNVWQWAVPFCAFFTTFTIVMTILVLSTDFKGHHFHFNSTNVWAFENLYQDSPFLINEIRTVYIKAPQKQEFSSRYNESMTLTRSVFSILGRKKRGTFIECEGNIHDGKSGTEYLENKLGWSGLITQPHPHDFANLISSNRPRSHKANICISPTTNPKHALFRDSSLDYNLNRSESLTTIPCFPLYSLMVAFNSTALDLLVLNSVPAQLQVLKTVPYSKVIINVIMIIDPSASNPCCNVVLINFLSSKGFKQVTQCPLQADRCAFSCTKSHINCLL